MRNHYKVCPAVNSNFKVTSKIYLKDFDPNDDGGFGKDEAAIRMQSNLQVIKDLTYKLYAENRRSLLVVLQGIDTAGKDGTIRHVMEGVNPQTCQVVSFKKPSAEELDHDFLWRIYKKLPARGDVTIFNRSHYEDVLVVRVHNLLPNFSKEDWKKRYDIINNFERLVAEQGTHILKFFLHISQQEQTERLQARLDDPSKNWKFCKSDLEERKFWDDYQNAFEEMINNCHEVPWYIVPANRKWHRNFVVSSVLRHALEKMDPKFPEPDPDIVNVKL